MKINTIVQNPWRKCIEHAQDLQVHVVSTTVSESKHINIACQRSNHKFPYSSVLSAEFSTMQESWQLVSSGCDEPVVFRELSLDLHTFCVDKKVVSVPLILSVKRLLRRGYDQQIM